MAKQKTQFNMREFLESTAYTEKLALNRSEINSNSVLIDRTRNNTLEEIKAAKKAYNKLIKDPEASKAIKDELLNTILNNAKKPLKSNFKQ